MHNGNVYWLSNGFNYGNAFAARAVIFKTDIDLNPVDMCYGLGDTPVGFSVSANTVSVWKDLSTFEPMVAFDLSKGPFLETLAFSLDTQDISNFYPLPDTTGGCVTPRLDPLVLPQQDLYLGSTKQQKLSFKEEHCQGAPMTVTTGALPSFASLTSNVVYFNPNSASQVGMHSFSVTVTGPDGRAISGTVSLEVHPNQAPLLSNPPTA